MAGGAGEESLVAGVLVRVAGGGYLTAEGRWWRGVKLSRVGTR